MAMAGMKDADDDTDDDDNNDDNNASDSGDLPSTFVSCTVAFALLAFAPDSLALESVLGSSISFITFCNRAACSLPQLPHTTLRVGMCKTPSFALNRLDRLRTVHKQPKQSLPPPVPVDHSWH